MNYTNQQANTNFEMEALGGVDPLNLELIRKTDPEIAVIIEKEMYRQQNTLELIASENIASPAVMAAQGSILTNKYAEGYPDKRYYGGCEYIDQAEELAIERAKKLFQADYANVQAHSGSQANMAVYFAFLKPGDTVLAMDLAHGGHLTHGSPVSFSGKLYRFVHYGVNRESGMLDYEEIAAIAKAQKPKMIVCGASAYSRYIDFEAFADIARSVHALLMVDMAHIAGLVAAGVHPSPIAHADVVTSTTHKTMRGPRGGLILAKKEHRFRLNSQIFPGIQGGPLMHVIAAKALAFKEAMSEEFKTYQNDTVANARTLAASLMKNGTKIVSGGTDNHMMLLDLTPLKITGKEAQAALGRAGITVNKNSIPFETLGPTTTSGIRLGTPVVTSRGMKQKEMTVIAKLVAGILKNPRDEKRIRATQEKARALCDAFGLYQNRCQEVLA